MAKNVYEAYDIINTFILTVICYNNDMFVVIKNSLLLSAVILSP